MTFLRDRRIKRKRIEREKPAWIYAQVYPFE